MESAGKHSGVEDTEISMFEAATILTEMASSKMDGHWWCEEELKKPIRKRKILGVPDIAKPPRKAKLKEMKLSSTPAMPVAMRERIAEMGGYEIQLVIQKQLHDTDLNKNHGRLSLPIKKLRFDFATEEETRLLNQHGNNKNVKKGMNVMIIDPLLRQTVICLKKWKIGSRDIYCLMTHWNSFAQQNSFQTGDVVQLWSFRMDGVDAANQTHTPHHLCFAMANPHISDCL